MIKFWHLKCIFKLGQSPTQSKSCSHFKLPIDSTKTSRSIASILKFRHRIKARVILNQQSWPRHFQPIFMILKFRHGLRVKWILAQTRSPPTGTFKLCHPHCQLIFLIVKFRHLNLKCILEQSPAKSKSCSFLSIDSTKTRTRCYYHSVNSQISASNQSPRHFEPANSACSYPARFYDPQLEILAYESDVK